MRTPLPGRSPARLHRRLALVVLLLAATAPAAAAQGGTATVEGTAASEEDGTPLPFALVRLLPAEGPAAAPRQVVTSAEGRFRFPRVPAGDYRLQLLRIGHRPVLSPVLRVQAGETLRQALRAATRVMELPTVTVHGEATCLDGAQLATDAPLATLWGEAQKGVEIRRAFELQYRFVRFLRQEGQIRRRLLGPTPLRRVDTLVNEPDSALAREARRREAHRARGYAEDNLLSLPDERELLHDDFLRDHCLETRIATDDGMLGLRFRPVAARRDGVDIRGVVWVDADTYLMRRIDAEWLDGDDVMGEASEDYADVAVGGSALRLPSGGRVALHRLRGAARLVVSRVTATFAFAYHDFAPVAAR